jgi:TolA-binding protein
MNHIPRETLEQLMQGRDMAAFPDAAAHLKTCPDCRKEADLILFRREWLIAAEAEGGNAGPSLTPEEWQSAFDKAWEKSSGAAKIIHSGNRFYRALYALAACLILALGLYIALKPAVIAEQKSAATIAAPEKPLNQGLPARRMEISRNTAAIASGESDVRLTRNSGTEVTAELSRGSALFSVEPGRYKAFHVSTPDAEVTVTGTIFDVRIQDRHTCVSVLRGSVAVLYKKLKASITLAKEETSRPDSLRIIVKPMTPEEKAEITTTLEKMTSSLLDEKQVPLARVRETVPVAPLSAVLDEKLTIGLKDLNKGDFNGALAVFKGIKASGLKTNAVQTAYFESALLLIKKTGRIQEGITVLEDYLKQFENGVYTEEALAELVSSARQQGSPDRIIRFAEKYIALFPEKGNTQDFIYETATLLREAKREYKASAEYYSLFLEKYPRDFRTEDAFFWLGKCHLMTGNKTQARDVYNTYLGKYPEGRWVSDIKALLQK